MIGMSIMPSDGTGTPTVTSLRTQFCFLVPFHSMLHTVKLLPGYILVTNKRREQLNGTNQSSIKNWGTGVKVCLVRTIYQYFLCTWLLLLSSSTCSAASSLLANRRAPVISFSRPRQGSSWELDLTLIPSIILERTGSTEEMVVSPEESDKTKGTFLNVQA